MRRALLVLVLATPGLAHAQLPDRIEPVEYGDDTARVRFSLFAQLQLSLRAGDNGPAELTPRLRRARPIVHARFFDDLLAARLHVEANPEEPELIDAYVELNMSDALRVRAGQLKVPFTDYWQRSLTEMAVDWPLSSRWFGGERQLGAMAHGELGDGYRYAFGVFSGQNRRSSFARELTRLYGESPPNPSSLVDGTAPDEMHAELVGRFAHHADGVSARESADRAGGGLRHALALSFAWDTDPVHGRDFAFRVAPEALLRYEHFSLVLVGYLGWAPTAGEPATFAAAGGLAELSWLADRHLELTLRYARVAVTEALRDDADASLTGQHELTAAVQVPILGRGLIVQLDLGWLRAEKLDGARDDARARLQLQAAF